MKPVVKQVHVEEILKLRHRVLRSGRPFSTAYFTGDELDTTFHFASVYNSKTIGCLSFMHNNHPKFDDKKAYQLRGMAVDKDFRGKNIGQELLKFAERQLKLEAINFIWCNVRTSAKTFYTKQAYQQKGDIFEIPYVGPHVLMFKKL